MPAIPPLSGGKQTFRELPENDAHDPIAGIARAMNADIVEFSTARARPRRNKEPPPDE